ncbi:hypothetical protein C8Q74DRAFT_864828 [Fomes fomentarius]|nr:hypothetical protein C8Q74DRAFT_864828 [Fomes fomentarius]
MIDEKAPPPSYMAPQGQHPQQPQTSYTPPGQLPPAQSYPQPQQQYASPQGPPPQGQLPKDGYFNTQAQGPVGGVTGYPPAQTPQMANMSAGQQYQQQLFAQCAAGNHDVTTKYGVFGIIMAVVCFPCGLICLTDTEKRCARCGVRLD